EAIGAAAPWIFIAAAVLVAYTSKGKLAAVAALIPFVLLIVGLQAFIMEQKEATFTTSFFLGIATGPLIFDLFSALSPVGRRAMAQEGKREFNLAPDVRPAGGRGLPNPFRALDGKQLAYTGGSAAITSATFVLSPRGHGAAHGCARRQPDQERLSPTDDRHQRAQRHHGVDLYRRDPDPAHRDRPAAVAHGRRPGRAAVQRSPGLHPRCPVGHEPQPARSPLDRTV